VRARAQGRPGPYSLTGVGVLSVSIKGRNAGTVRIPGATMDPVCL